MKIFEVKEKISSHLTGLEKSSFYKFLTAAKKANPNVTAPSRKNYCGDKKRW